MPKSLKAAAFLVVALAALGTLMFVTHGQEAKAYSGVFSLPSKQPLTLSEYLGRLVTFRAPSQQARPYGYIYYAFGLPRTPFYKLPNSDPSIPRR